MKKGPKIGYARVSTREQNLDLQLDALKAAGCDEIFTDQGVSVSAIERDCLSQALGAVGEGHTHIIWKLERPHRSSGFLADLIAEYGGEGRGFVVLQDGIDTNTSDGKLVFHIMVALAEFKRDLISKRTTAGMVVARRREKHTSRRTELSREQTNHAKSQISLGEETITRMASVLGIHRNTFTG